VNLFVELKRRGVVQVGVAYVVTSWLLVQVADTVLPAFSAPDWAMRATIILLAIGFPITLVISWVFDLTSKGIIRTTDLPGDEAITPARTGRLNYVIIGVLTAAVIMFALDKFVWKTELGPGNDSEAASIAVLPFQNMSQDPANDAFAAGIHDDLLTQLSKIHAFRTLSRTSMLRYSDSLLPIPEIADQVGAQVVLEGGVQRSEDRVRINAQLIDGENDLHLWAETYDRQLSAQNIFAIQSEIARAIAAALKATLSKDEEARLDLVPTESLEAYDAYTSGLASMYAHRIDDYDLAVANFLLATELDPGFASAWAGLCRAELSRYQKSSDRLNFDSAEAACLKALELDDARVEVHIALGTLYRYFGQYARAEVSLQRANYAKAEQQLEKALSLNNMTVEGKVELSRVLMRQDRLSEALAELREAEKLSPTHYDVLNAYFSFYYTYSNDADRFETAASYAAKMTSLRPDLPQSWNNLGTAQFMLDRYADAAEAWSESMRLEPTRTAYTNTGLALYYAGRFRESAEMQRKATGLAPEDHRSWGRLADALKHLDGEQELATETYAHAAGLARKMLDVNDQDWRTRGLLAVYLANSGDTLGAGEAASQAIEDSGRRSEALFYGALSELIMGREEQSLSLLEEAVRRDDDYRHLIANDPVFAPLAANQRFVALLGPQPDSG
jgi:TolB-like protein/cytochrome c-type biogenesis protein CcmH/NrfG